MIRMLALVLSVAAAPVAAQSSLEVGVQRMDLKRMQGAGKAYQAFVQVHGANQGAVASAQRAAAERAARGAACGGAAPLVLMPVGQTPKGGLVWEALCRD